METTQGANIFTLNNFKIQIIISDSLLIIKAKNSSTLANYSLTINNDTVKQITDNLCANMNSCYKLLMSHFEKHNPDVEVMISEPAVLEFQITLRAFDMILENRSFKIHLEESDQPFDPTGVELTDITPQKYYL